MVIGIYDTKTIRDVQKEFAEFYPNLKVEFYAEPYEEDEWAPGKKQFPINRTIGDVKTTESTEHLEIHAGFTTEALEKAFKQLFGLIVRVFRLEGDEYTLIPLNSTFTLEDQDEAGRTVSDKKQSRGNMHKI